VKTNHPATGGFVVRTWEAFLKERKNETGGDFTTQTPSGTPGSKPPFSDMKQPSPFGDSFPSLGSGTAMVSELGFANCPVPNVCPVYVYSGGWLILLTTFFTNLKLCTLTIPLPTQENGAVTRTKDRRYEKGYGRPNSEKFRDPS
jgi:hypothetical protein